VSETSNKDTFLSSSGIIIVSEKGG